MLPQGSSIMLRPLDVIFIYYYTSREDRKAWLAAWRLPNHHGHWTAALSCHRCHCMVYTKQQTIFSTAAADLLAIIFIDILPNWGLFGLIKQICHASVGIMIECFPSGGWFSLWETFHQDTHTGMSYLYDVSYMLVLISPQHFMWKLFISS